MKRINSTAARVIASALAAGLVAMAVGGISLARAGGSDRTMTITEKQVNATFVSISHTQQGAPGDQAIFRSVVMNSRGQRIGSSSIVCEIVFGGKLQCSGVYVLPGGTLTGTALVPQSQASSAPVHVAITGGTGRYDEVSGQATSTPQSQTVNKTVIDLD
ncbi:MAG: hypothetical protein ACTHNU_00510 [Gaiellales bacterium]